MTPNPGKLLGHQLTLNFKYPISRKLNWEGGYLWLEGKKIDDETGGLWRVHDNLYDVTEFVDKHPGGRSWLELTKGTDITEAFEVHHLTRTPEDVLQKYFIRKATHRRNSPFTFKDDGFFRTLKMRVVPILKNVQKSRVNMSDYMTDSLLISTFVFAILANVFWSYTLGMIAGFLLSCTTVAAHNYFHRKDNFRMYYFNLSMMNFQEWRITHALSHHLFPNTIIDYEISFLEPIIEYLPKKKPLIVKYGSSVYVIPIWFTLFYASYIKKFTQYLFHGTSKYASWTDFVPFLIPLTTQLFSTQSLLWTIWMWLLITGIGSLCFAFVGFNAAHHAPEIFHDGDTPRSRDEIDWGIYQLDTVSERYDIKGSPFLVLTNFGDHALHHFFPTLDHGILNSLYPVFEQTMKEFNVALRMRSQLDMVKGQFKQLAKEEPNPKPPQ